MTTRAICKWPLAGATLIKLAENRKCGGEVDNKHLTNTGNVSANTSMLASVGVFFSFYFCGIVNNQIIAKCVSRVLRHMQCDKTRAKREQHHVTLDLSRTLWSRPWVPRKRKMTLSHNFILVGLGLSNLNDCHMFKPRTNVFRGENQISWMWAQSCIFLKSSSIVGGCQASHGQDAARWRLPEEDEEEGEGRF